MSRRNKFIPKFGKCSSETLEKAKRLVESWREALEEHTNRQDITIINGIDNNLPYCQNSVTSWICGWIEQGTPLKRDFHVPDWEEQWDLVLERIPKCAFLRRGYQGFEPNLAWLFKPSKNGERGIDKVLSGRYDAYTTTHRSYGEDALMV